MPNYKIHSPKQVLVTRSKGVSEPVGHLAANRFPTPLHRFFKAPGLMPFFLFKNFFHKVWEKGIFRKKVLIGDSL